MLPAIRHFSILSVILTVSAFDSLLGANFTVGTLAELQAKINEARAGDVITLKDGSYTTSNPIEVSCVGTGERGVVIAAESVGGAVLTGTHGFNVIRPAAYVTMRGFTFAHASGRNTVAAGTSNVRFTRNTFQCLGNGPYLSVSGDNAQVDYNEFRNKNTLGNMISVTGTGGQVARKLWIHHNYLHDFANAHGNGAETIRFGLSGLSMSTGDGLVEHNLFVRCTGENELISNKSCGNTYRYNTFLDSAGAQLTLRHGNNCTVYGNYFKGTDGLRVFGDRHQIFSNYFEGNQVGIDLGNGDGEVADGAKLTSHDRPDGCVIAFNTLINSTIHYQMSRRANGLGASNITFSNNILQGGGVAAKIGGTNSGARWSGNLLWQAAGAGDLPAEGYTETDPRLLRGTDHILRPQPGSPAIDTAVGEFPAVVFDLDGQARVDAKDKGADELSSAPVCARVLTPEDVGPNGK